MKRFIFVLLLVLSASGLFAKDKVFFEKKYSDSFLGFYEASNTEKTNGYKYYIAIYDYMQNDEIVFYNIFCNDYEKIKDYFYTVREKGLSYKKPYFSPYVSACVTVYEYSKEYPTKTEIINIEEVYNKKDFGEDKETIIDGHICVLN